MFQKHLITLIFICVISRLFGQASGTASANLLYGRTFFKKERIAIKEYLSGSGFDADYRGQVISLQVLGTGGPSRSANLSELKDYYFSYNYVLPGYFRTQTHEVRIGGGYLSLQGGIDLFSDKKQFDLIPQLGYNWGRMRINEKLDGIESKYRNVFFAVKGGMSMNIILKRLVIHLEGNYQLDLTNPSWKRQEGRENHIAGTKFHGFLCYGGLGYRF